MIYGHARRRKRRLCQFKDGGVVHDDDQVTALPSHTQSTYNSIKDIPIAGIHIAREPVSRFIQLLLNASLGSLTAVKDRYGIDELFHTFAIITLSDGRRFRVDKNQNVAIKPYHRGKEEIMQINLQLTRNSGLTLKKLFNNAYSKLGSRFYHYSFDEDNCQAFLSTLLSASGLSTANTASFVKQPLDKMLDDLPGRVKDAAQLVTDTAAVLDKAAQLVS